jgi:flagellar biosynthesis/type III secretory pathway chaperone
MTTPATRTPLEAALDDVHTALADLLVAADEQYAALVERDRDRLENVTRQQERLAARLASAEGRRLQALNGRALAEAVSSEPRARELSAEIASQVRVLKDKQTRAAGLLQKSIEITDQTLKFLHRLVTPTVSVYGARGVAVARPSLLVDSRA